MAENHIPYIEGVPPPSENHILARIRQEDGSEKLVWLDPSSIKSAPLRHQDINELLPYVRWIWRQLEDNITWCRSFEDFELGFMRDSNPEKEVAIWLRATFCYLEFSNSNPKTDKAIVFDAIQHLMNGRDDLVKPDTIASTLKGLMSQLPDCLKDPSNFNEDGHLISGPEHLK